MRLSQITVTAGENKEGMKRKKRIEGDKGEKGMP